MRLYKIFIIVISSIVMLFQISCTSNNLNKNSIEELYQEYVKVADGYVAIEKYNEAITYYERALPSEIIHYDVLYKIGRTYALASKWSNAKESFEELLKRDPKNFSLRTSLAYVTAMSGDMENAISQYKKLLEENPGNQSIFENYITLLLTDKQVVLAARQIEKLEMEFPESTMIQEFKNKLEKLTNENKSDDAETDSEQKTESIETNPDLQN